MIRLKNINITFDRFIVSNGEMIISDGCLTAIVGKSGCGKTSLLYLLGLISSNTDYEYQFNDQKIKINDDQMVSRIRKYRIGYVFQDNTLVDSLSVRDNIIMASEVAGIPASDSEIEQLLDFVGLEIDGNDYPKILSGGEQQRVAIACAMAKKPDLIIADEPTSALDQENSDKIMAILQQYAKVHGKMVVVATHQQAIGKLADRIYTIEHGNLVDISEEKRISGCLGQSNRQDYPVDERKPLGFSFFGRYVIRSNRKMRFQRRLMILLCAISIAFSTAIGTMGNHFLVEQQALMELISNREIFLVNLTLPSKMILDYDENLSITESQRDQLENINRVDQLYPYMEFRSVSHLLDEPQAGSTASVMVVSNEVARRFDFNSTEDPNSPMLVIAPYYPDQAIDKQLDRSFQSTSAEAIFLSAQLAELLQIDESENELSLDVRIGVPIGVVPVDLSVQNNPENSALGSSVRPADVDCAIVQDLRFDVTGVLKTQVLNNYSSSGNYVIYLPIDQMIRIQSDAWQQADRAGLLPGQVENLQPWNPSAMMLYAKNFNDIDTIIRQVSAISSDFVCKSNYQDIESMNLMIGNVKRTMTWISIIVLLIVLLLMAVVFINYVLGRKFETAVLKANGLTRQEILKIIAIESSALVLKIFFFSMLALSLASIVVNMLFNLEMISIGWQPILILFLVSLSATVVPAIGSAVVMNQVKPDQVFRN